MMDNRIMQTGTSLSGNGRPQRSKIILIVLCVFFIAAIGAILLITHNHSSSFPRADQEQSTEFQGVDSFISSGLTTGQANGLVKDFSEFSPKAKTISIDPESLSPAPHDPNLDQPFTINFSVAIDSTHYKGTVFYSGLNTVRLVLYSGTGNPVFDSNLNH